MLKIPGKLSCLALMLAFSMTLAGCQKPETQSAPKKKGTVKPTSDEGNSGSLAVDPNIDV